jgi:hypothetical protein
MYFDYSPGTIFIQCWAGDSGTPAYNPEAEKTDLASNERSSSFVGLCLDQFMIILLFEDTSLTYRSLN